MKHVHRFFVGQELTAGEPVRLQDDEAFHAVKVLRLKAGDAVELADQNGRVFQAVVTDAVARHDPVLEAVPGSEAMDTSGSLAPAPRLTVVQALPSGRKMDLIVEKLSEIGVDRLVPVLTEKSVIREPRGKGEKAARWGRVAKAAAAQAKRTGVMAIDETVELGRWLEGFDGKALTLSTEVEGEALGEALREMLDEAGRGDEDSLTHGLTHGLVQSLTLSLIIGPEAGFSSAETDAMKKHGVRFASLGNMVLRTETAALVAATVVMHRLGIIG